LIIAFRAIAGDDDQLSLGYNRLEIITEQGLVATEPAEDHGEYPSNSKKPIYLIDYFAHSGCQVGRSLDMKATGIKGPSSHFLRIQHTSEPLPSKGSEFMQKISPTQ
jgi:hypothetical protein